MSKIRTLEIEIHRMPEGHWETRVKGSEGNLWDDFFTLLEALSFMIIANAHEQRKAPDEIKEYVIKHMGKATKDYKVK